MNNASTYWGLMINVGANDWRLGYGSQTGYVGWNLRWDNGSTVWANGSFRAPIFYDSDDTGYYSDPNGTSRLSTIYCGDVYNDLGGWFRNYGTTGIYNQSYANHFYASDSHYWNLAGTGGGYGGLVLRDNYQNTIKGYHYWDSSGVGLLNDLGGWSVRQYYGSSYGGMLYGSWTSTGDHRAPIFYDYNDTGYYVDANSTSRMNLINADYLRSYNYMYLDNNYGCTLMGTYSSYRYQGVWSMGSSWLLPIDGTTTGNLYGMCWSHPNAGGTAGNLDSHGLLILINGGFGSCMSYSIRASGNVTAYSDERLKTNWRDMPEDFVARLAKVKVGIYDRMDGEKITQVGVSAQSLQTLLPQAVTEANDDIKTLSVSYGNAALASAVELAKEVVLLKQTISSQEQRIAKLEALVNNLLMR